MKNTMPATICKNCDHPIDNKFCPHCGQKTSTERFTLKQLGHEFLHGFLHLEHGMLFTAKELALRPGKMLRGYLAGQRIGYFNPFTFILLLGGVSAFLLPKLHWHSFFIDLGVLSKNAVDQEAWNSSLKHYSVRLLFSIPLYAVCTRIFYFNKGFNFYEHLIANTYLRAEVTLFMLLVAPIEFLVDSETAVTAIKSTIVIISLLYVSWAYTGLFHKSMTIPALLKGFAAAVMAAFIELILLNLIISKTLPF